MSVWITDSVSLLRSFAGLLTSPAIFNLVGCLLCLFVAKLFKDFTGG